MNYNAVLGVPQGASSNEIQAAFRKNAMEVHPDHSNSPEAAEAFARIKEARDELMKRARSTEAARDDDNIRRSTAAAMQSTAAASFLTPAVDDLFDGMTPQEVAHVQMLDSLALAKPKRSLFRRAKEPLEVIRHRKKLKTTNDRIIGKY